MYCIYIHKKINYKKKDYKVSFMPMKIKQNRSTVWIKWKRRPMIKTVSMDNQSTPVPEIFHQNEEPQESVRI